MVRFAPISVKVLRATTAPKRTADAAPLCSPTQHSNPARAAVLVTLAQDATSDDRTPNLDLRASRTDDVVCSAGNLQEACDIAADDQRIGRRVARRPLHFAELPFKVDE